MKSDPLLGFLRGFSLLKRIGILLTVITTYKRAEGDGIEKR
jgi:hypothetical protein